jgi:hypothetical protein
MSYQLTIDQVNSITDAECAFATLRLLPAWEDIPEEFKRRNIYTALVEALMFGGNLPDCEIELMDGLSPEKLNRCTMAHLQSWGVKHEHKVAGVAYMISCVATLIPSANSQHQEE